MSLGNFCMREHWDLPCLSPIYAECLWSGSLLGKGTRAARCKREWRLWTYFVVLLEYSDITDITGGCGHSSSPVETSIPNTGAVLLLLPDNSYLVSYYTLSITIPCVASYCLLISDNGNCTSVWCGKITHYTSVICDHRLWNLPEALLFPGCLSTSHWWYVKTEA